MRKWSIATLKEKTYEAYIVGGVVRDFVLNVDFNDIDKMDCIILVAGGKKKAESLLAVSHSIPNGIFVTDEGAALEMLRLAGK